MRPSRPPARRSTGARNAQAIATTEVLRHPLGADELADCAQRWAGGSDAFPGLWRMAVEPVP